MTRYWIVAITLPLAFATMYIRFLPDLLQNAMQPKFCGAIAFGGMMSTSICALLHSRRISSILVAHLVIAVPMSIALPDTDLTSGYQLAVVYLAVVVANACAMWLLAVARNPGIPDVDAVVQPAATGKTHGGTERSEPIEHDEAIRIHASWPALIVLMIPVFYEVQKALPQDVGKLIHRIATFF